MANSSVIQNMIQSINTLSLSSPVYNVLYENTNTIFDICINQVDTFNQIKQIDDNSNFAYDIYWSNDPANHINVVENIEKLHIHNIIYFRNLSNKNVKKEDKFLIQNRFRSSIQIAQNKNTQADWHMNKNSFILEYGIPKLIINENLRNSSILVINTINSKNLTQMFNAIKEYWPDSYMLTNVKKFSYNELCNIMQKYKICIETYDAYNILLAMANGCRVVSTINPDNEDILMIPNYNSIIDHLTKQLIQYDKNLFNHSDYITTKYCFNKFSTSINNIIQSILPTPVII